MFKDILYFKTFKNRKTTTCSGSKLFFHPIKCVEQTWKCPQENSSMEAGRGAWRPCKVLCFGFNLKFCFFDLLHQSPSRCFDSSLDQQYSPVFVFFCFANQFTSPNLFGKNMVIYGDCLQQLEECNATRPWLVPPMSPRWIGRWSWPTSHLPTWL